MTVKKDKACKELLELIPGEFPKYVEEGVKEKGFNKADCYDKFSKDHGVYEKDLLAGHLLEILNTFDDVFYNVLETTDEYQNLLSNMDSCNYYNNVLKTHITIDVIMEITKQFNLSIEEVDKLLISHELKLYLNDIDYVKRRITEISSEKLSELLEMRSYDLLENETILTTIMHMDNANIVGRGMIVRLDEK